MSVKEQRQLAGRELPKYAGLDREEWIACAVAAAVFSRESEESPGVESLVNNAAE